MGRRKKESCCNSLSSEKDYEIYSESYDSYIIDVAAECDTSITSLSSSSSSSFEDLCCTGPVCCPEECKPCKKKKPCKKPCKKRKKKCKPKKKRFCSSSSSSSKGYYDVDKTKKKCRKCRKSRCRCDKYSSSSSSSHEEQRCHQRAKFCVTETDKRFHTCSWRIDGPVWKISSGGKHTVGGTIKVTEGTELVFRIEPDSDGYGHQEFYLTEDCLGGGKFPEFDLTDRVACGVVKYNVDCDSPRKLYYQSTGGELRGGMITVNKRRRKH